MYAFTGFRSGEIGFAFQGAGRFKALGAQTTFCISSARQQQQMRRALNA